VCVWDHESCWAWISRMSEQEKAIVRACLEQALRGMAEAYQVESWWIRLSDANKRSWKEFYALVACFRDDLRK